MSLDGAFLHIVKTEIERKIPIGARVDKIHQPSRDEIVITFRNTSDAINNKGAPQKEQLLLSANAMSARVCITGNAIQNPNTPPLFCLTLRKNIGNGRLFAISQGGEKPNLERVLNLDFVGTNELGDTVNNRLIIEIMGRTSNIILINRDTLKIIDSIKRVTDDISKTRRILPKLPYTPPTADLSRHCLLNCRVRDIDLSFDDRALIKTLEGVSPIFVREAVFYANKDKERLISFLENAKSILLGGEPCITVVSDLEGKPKDFSFVDINQYGSQMTKTRIGTANELLDRFFYEKSNAQRIKQRSGDIMKTLNNAYERLSRKIETQKLELENCKNRECFRIYGDLINANIYRLKKGDAIFKTENYITGGEENIKLSPHLTPAQNAQKYYLKYRKLSTAEKMLTKFIEEEEEELLYLDTVIDLASRATTNEEINEIRKEMARFTNKNNAVLEKDKPLKGSRNKRKQSSSKPLEPLRFLTDDGYEVLVGRNNHQNDELTFKIAKPNDIWFHTKDIAGSHVILRKGSLSDDVPEKAIIQAAIIAASHSKGRGSSNVPVDYTLVKNVNKPRGAKPGFVIFTNNKTLYVTPDNL